MRGVVFMTVGGALLVVALARGEAWAGLGSVAAGAACATVLRAPRVRALVPASRAR